jgi:hypothetical protein
MRLRAGSTAQELWRRLAQTRVECVKRRVELFLSNAVGGGRYALRACIVNFHTSERDVDAVPETVVRTARAV